MSRRNGSWSLRTILFYYSFFRFSVADSSTSTNALLFFLLLSYFLSLSCLPPLLPTPPSSPYFYSISFPMGNQNVKENSEIFRKNCAKTKKGDECLINFGEKTLLKLEKTIFETYPFLSTDTEDSACLVDLRLPDQPLIYVNDQFSKLTLYPKEEIIGRNCRFLQGKLCCDGMRVATFLFFCAFFSLLTLRFHNHKTTIILVGKFTNRKTVKRIQEAISAGEALDVELLNYRKDGLPFFNNFLLLPVWVKLSMKDHGKPPTHYIAVQKDVTLVKPQLAG